MGELGLSSFSASGALPAEGNCKMGHIKQSTHCSTIVHRGSEVDKVRSFRDAIEAFRFWTKQEPTKTQREAALNFGGMNDLQTISSLPKQISLIEGAFERLSGKEVDDEVSIHLHRQLDLRAWEKVGPAMKRLGPLKARAILGLLDAKWHRCATPIAIHPIRELFREEFGSAPDDESFTFWCEKLEQHGLAWVRRKMVEE